MSSQRVAKVESIVLQVVAGEIRELLGGDAARVTVTRVDASPDLRNAMVWIGLLGREDEVSALWERLEHARGDLQRAVAGQLTMKYVPQLHLRLDTGGAYAAEIDRLLKDL